MTTTTRQSLTTVDVPQRFYDDHKGRDLPSGTVVKTLSRTYRVDLDAEAFRDLLSDAEHYAGGAMDDMYADGDFATASALIASAKATVRALTAATPPAPVDPAPSESAPEPGRAPRTWDATQYTDHLCQGGCGQSKPAKAFPTTSKPGLRGVVCRSCRDAARTTAS